MMPALVMALSECYESLHDAQLFAWWMIAAALLLGCLLGWLLTRGWFRAVYGDLIDAHDDYARKIRKAHRK